MMSQKQMLHEIGWGIESDRDEDVRSACRLAVRQFVMPCEEYATWDVMQDRAAGCGALGTQRLAEFLLRNSDDIPAEWRAYALIFPQTVWTSITGHALCPCLEFRDGAWMLGYHWFLYDFHHDDRFLVPL